MSSPTPWHTNTSPGLHSFSSEVRDYNGKIVAVVTNFEDAALITSRVNESPSMLLECRATELTDLNTELLAALKKAQEDINWMLNSGKLLNGHVFDYLHEAIAKAEGKL